MKRLSYIEDARCLKVNNAALQQPTLPNAVTTQRKFSCSNDVSAWSLVTMVLHVLVQTKKALCAERSKRQVCCGHPKKGDSQLRFWVYGYQPLTVNKTILWNITTYICFGKEDNIKAGIKEITFECVKWLNWLRVCLFVSSKTKFMRLSRGRGRRSFLTT